MYLHFNTNIFKSYIITYARYIRREHYSSTKIQNNSWFTINCYFFPYCDRNITLFSFTNNSFMVITLPTITTAKTLALDGDILRARETTIAIAWKAIKRANREKKQIIDK